MIVSKLKTRFKNRRKHKVVFKLESGKTFCTVKFTEDEMNKIKYAAKYENVSIEHFFSNVFKDLVKQRPYKMIKDYKNEVSSNS